MKLSLFCFAQYGRNARISLYRLTKKWNEDSVTWNIPWATPGGDYNTAVLDSYSIDSVVNVWKAFDVTPAVKDMHENRCPNYGFIILVDTVYVVDPYYWSSEYSEQSLRPKLTITFLTDTEVPVVSLTSPAGGETFVQGTPSTISWVATDNKEVISRAIYFSQSKGQAWTLIDSATGNTGNFQWAVKGDVASSDCRIKIVAHDDAGNAGSAESGIFTIENATGIIPTPMNSIKASTYQVTIRNIQGRKIASFETNNINTMHQIKNSLPSGMHIVSIATSGEKTVRKFWLVR